ncbi:MAG: glycoside hydrolase family protein [Acidobacteria bacterium]|nr:glycoside hydrolase family protein [Acidobacteriota bacterium]
MNIREFIKQEEGLRLKPYRCPTGHWTVGYGHNLEAHGESIPERITLDQAEEYLTADIIRASADCYSHIENFSNLSDARQAVLVSMCFQMGISGLMKFRRMLAAIKREDWSDAAAQMMDSKWARQTPARAMRQAQMMISEEWASAERNNHV